MIARGLALAGLLALAGCQGLAPTQSVKPSPAGPPPPPPTADMVMCPADVKTCPDGSYVSRTGPRCEFAACPAEKK